MAGASGRGTGLRGAPRASATSSRNVRGARASATRSPGAHQTHPWRRSHTWLPLLGCALLENYEECDGDQQLGDEQEGAVIQIAGYGDVTVALRSGDGWCRVRFKRVAHTPQLSSSHCDNLITLAALASEDDGHTVNMDERGITLNLDGGISVFFPRRRHNLYAQDGYRPGPDNTAVNNASLIAHVGINVYHCS